MSKQIINNIENKINKDEVISPCLFLDKNNELLNSNVKSIAQELMKSYGIPLSYIYTFADNWERIKIWDIKKFFEISNLNTNYRFQIFIIENISRLTLQAANSCLKLFEEPWISNIIFLTWISESWILETILSRVKIIYLHNQNSINIKNDSYYSLIENFFDNKDLNIIWVFFEKKLDKKDYLLFLENLLLYLTNNFKFIDILKELDEDINAIKQNNISSKYIVDKYILKIM